MDSVEHIILTLHLMNSLTIREINFQSRFTGGGGIRSLSSMS
jgi:hypothetical protein